VTQEIPVIDLVAQYLSIEFEVNSAIMRVLSKGKFILGEECISFEKEFAAYCHVGYGIGVATGTDALLLALRACEIGPGHEVITSAHTAVGTIAAIELTGARPVLVDVDPQTFTLDPVQIPGKISSRTRAIIPVHLYGCPADLTPIIEIAKSRKLFVIEDCAQAHGAFYKNRSVGSWGHLSAFSFYPTKNLGAYGDAGMVLTDNPSLAEKLSLIRQYGWKQRYISEIKGVNSRLDDIQAAILRVKLRHLDDWNQRRQSLAGLYNILLAECGLDLPVVHPYANHVYHQYVIQSHRRDELRSFLARRSIHTGIHYPVPVHLQPAFRNLGYGLGDFSNTEKLSGQILTLPLYPEMPDHSVEIVCQAIQDFTLANQ
jgi:dTDP-4-amino-4,6-dideoxygalactose transaminase